MTRIVDVTLEQLVERSTHIVIVEVASPANRTEVVPVVEAGKEYPPFHRLVYRYRVRESLRGDLKPGSSIEVLSAHDAQNERVYRLVVTQGVHKSVFESQYRPRVPFTAGQPHILFLNQNPDQGRYVEAAGDSAEGLGMRSEIERLLKRASP